MPRIKHRRCPDIVKKFDSPSEALELFTMKDTTHRWAGACGVLHDREGGCRVATDAYTVLAVPTTKPPPRSQVYAYRRIAEFGAYKGDPLLGPRFPNYQKAFTQPVCASYQIPVVVLRRLVSALTRQCDKQNSRWYRVLSLNKGQTVVDCFRVLQLLYAVQHLRKRTEEVEVRAGTASSPVLFLFDSGIRAALMPFYAERVPRTSKTVPIEEVVQ